MKYLREFLKRYIADWLTILCGPLALPLTAYGVYASNTIYNRLLFTGLLVVCLIVSSFRVWKKEYEQTLQAEFPLVQYPGGATEFAILQDGRIVTQYVAVQNLTVTNRSHDKPVSVNMYLQITRRPTDLMFSPENEPMPNWRELANLQDVPNSTQLTFPLSISPRTSVGGHAIFLMSRNMRYGVLGAEGVTDEWFVYVEELNSGEKRVFPINVVGRSRASGGYEVVYARDPNDTRAA
ncbi:MAG TPA: hypothetical protein VE732_02680 [Nitrososphaera sp.]|jgi:hypothetical protein|nr:hypothetical protein [Nitrososphaera sp.]